MKVLHVRRHKIHICKSIYALHAVEMLACIVSILFKEILLIDNIAFESIVYYLSLV